MDKITEDMAIDRESKLAALAGDLIFDILDELNRSVDKKFIGRMKSGDRISPEDSWVAWGEKKAYTSIRSRLEQRIKLGEGARERLKPFMETI